MKQPSKVSSTQNLSIILLDKQSTKKSKSESLSEPKPILQIKNQAEDSPAESKKFSWNVYRKLLRYARREWKLFSIGILCLFTSSLMASAVPYLIGQILQAITNISYQDSVSQQSLNSVHWYFLSTILILAISVMFRTLVMMVIQERIAISLRSDIFSNFIHNDVNFFEQYTSGELSSRVGNDVEQAKCAASNHLTFFLRCIISVLTNICILLYMSLQLSMIILFLVPFYVLTTVIHNKRIKTLSKQYQSVQAESTSLMNQIFTGIQIVKAYATEKREIQRFFAIQNKGYNINYLKSFIQSLYFVVSIFLPNLGILLILWYGGRLVQEEGSGLKLGELTSFIMYCKAVSSEIMMISFGYNSIVSGTGSVEKVFSMMEQYQPQINEKSQMGNEEVTIEGQIEFKNVYFRYPKRDSQVLNNFSLKINAGEYVAFVGESGSGKSTIAKLIQRFYEIQSGTLWFDGVDSKRLRINSIRNSIGFVPQEPILFSGTIEENVTYGVTTYSYSSMVEACRESGCLDFILDQRLFPQGFKTMVGQKGNQLSGGQKQRISIARVLMKNPKIIIFDEATSSLDATSEHIVQKSIQRMTQSLNKRTIIVIAHRLSTIREASTIYVMRDGQIKEQGSHSALLQRKGYYFQLVSKQIQQIPAAPN